MSECDSELIAVYIAQKMREGATLEDGMKESLIGLDGVFTYFVATKDSLGMAKGQTVSSSRKRFYIT